MVTYDGVSQQCLPLHTIPDGWCDPQCHRDNGDAVANNAGNIDFDTAASNDESASCSRVDDLGALTDLAMQGVPYHRKTRAEQRAKFCSVRPLSERDLEQCQEYRIAKT